VEEIHLMAAFAAARAAVYGSGRRAAALLPRRGVKIIGRWLPMAKQPEYQAWGLREMAEYLGLQSCWDEAARLGAESWRVSHACANPAEGWLRRKDQAALLLRAGQPREAASVLGRPEIEYHPLHRARTALLCSAIGRALGTPGEAHTHLAQAYALIEANDLEHLRGEADALARQL
jgi:hypothetical protein